MTYEEAKIHVDYAWGEGLLLGSEMDAELKETIMNAIEKQIPKKPNGKFSIGGSDVYTAGLCPICNRGINYEMAFCDECGQAIDWREENG